MYNFLYNKQNYGLMFTNIRHSVSLVSMLSSHSVGSGSGKVFWIRHAAATTACGCTGFRGTTVANLHGIVMVVMITNRSILLQLGFFRTNNRQEVLRKGARSSILPLEVSFTTTNLGLQIRVMRKTTTTSFISKTVVMATTNQVVWFRRDQEE